MGSLVSAAVTKPTTSAASHAPPAPHRMMKSSRIDDAFGLSNFIRFYSRPAGFHSQRPEHIDDTPAPNINDHYTHCREFCLEFDRGSEEAKADKLLQEGCEAR